jgi:hypothetical protein
MGYIGCDLDGTLAVHEHGDTVETIGEPVPAMLARVKAWLAEGIEVRIITARVGATVTAPERSSQYQMIQDWCFEHLGTILRISAAKDYGMIALWDDRAVGVVRNTGVTTDQAAADTVVGAIATWLNEKSEHFAQNANIGPYTQGLVSELLSGAWRKTKA